MLLANPHLPWSDLFLWYEAQITAPGIDAYGATLVGIPVLAIAFNNNLGWTHTVNTFDGWDLYDLTLSGKGYLFDGEVRNFEQKTTDIKVKQADGTIKSEKLIIQNSIHGAVIKQKDGKALALKIADVLSKWDRQTNADSQGAVLFAAWLEATDFDTLFSKPWQANSPLSTPDGLANPQQAVTTLLAVANKIEQDYGAIDVPWGEVFRLRYGNMDLPANGGPGYLGIFRTVNFMPMEDSKRFQAFDGDSFVAAIEFSQPVKAMALTTYGNSTQSNSSSSEQLKLFAQKQLRPVWLTRQEVEAHSVKQKNFQP